MDYTEMACEACRAGAPPATEPVSSTTFLEQSPDWQRLVIDDEPRLRDGCINSVTLSRRWPLPMSSVRSPKSEGHHPALVTEWGRVTVDWWTHKIGDIHLNDLILAARSDVVYNGQGVNRTTALDRTERFYTIDRLLRSRQGTTLRAMMEEMEVSRATVRRDLEYMRDRLAAPILWDNETRCYRYDSDAEGEGEDRYALPGLWFNASEVHALMTMEHLLSSLQPGLLEPHIEPLRSRIRRLLDSG